MTTFKKLLRPISALSVLALGSALSFTVAAATPAPEFDIQGKPDFVKSLGQAANTKIERSTEETKRLIADVYNDKREQHVMSKHFEKGLTCVTCHDQQRQGGPDWMAKVTNPPMKKTCQDCHTVQADVQSHTRSHIDVDCIGCHMPNIPVVSKFEEALKGTDRFAAVRRAHLYKINTDAQASMVTKDPEKGWVYSRDKEDHGFVDLQWSCGRPAPADWTVCEGRGCHSPATSELDKGLIYKSQQEIAYEVQKVQRPVKESYDRIVKGVDRITKLLEITKMTPADQTETRLLLDKAAEIADLIKKDGSWGAHASHYIKDRLAAAESYLAKAQVLIDNGGYRHATK